VRKTYTHKVYEFMDEENRCRIRFSYDKDQVFIRSFEWMDGSGTRHYPKPHLSLKKEEYALDPKMKWLKEHAPESLPAHKAWETMRKRPMKPMDLEKTPIERAIDDCVKEINNGKK